MGQKYLAFLLSALCVCFTADVYADTVYKQINQNGDVVYTDKPSKGLKTEKRIQSKEFNSGIWNDRVHRPTGSPGYMTKKPTGSPANLGVPGTPVGEDKLPPLPGSAIVTMPPGVKASQLASPQLPETTPLPGAKKTPASQSKLEYESSIKKSKLIPSEAQTPEKDSQITADEAKERLEKALDDQKIGRDLQSGDRMGNVNGTSRLTLQYQDRQKMLKDAVDQAQKDLETAESQN